MSNNTIEHVLTPAASLPKDAERACLVGRAWVNGQGPVLVRVGTDGIFDLSKLAPTMTHLLEMENPAKKVREANAPQIGDTATVLANSAHDRRNPESPWFLAPCDLQAIKAAGVTFVSSMLERVIEEQARGDASRAQEVRSS